MGMSFNKMHPAVHRLIPLALLILITGCGATPRDPNTPQVVATTTQLADIARNVAPNAHVTAILKPNTDPHEYEVRPRDVKALAHADVVLRSGGAVDSWLDGALDAAGVDPKQVVSAGDLVEGDDPHWWQDPTLGAVAAREIGRAIPGGTPDRYVARLQRLDANVARCLSTVPPAERELVTSHDALGYYAR